MITESKGIPVDFCFSVSAEAGMSKNKVTGEPAETLCKMEITLHIPPSEEDYHELHRGYGRALAGSLEINPEWVTPISFQEWASYQVEDEVILELPKITIKEVVALFTHTHGALKWFEISLRFSDDRRRLWDLHMGDLEKLGTGITRLSETRKLKDWIFSEAGRAYFEGQVNRV